MSSKPRSPGENLRNNLRELMEANGDDTVSLSKKSGIPQRTVYHLVYTEQRASIEQAELLGRAYGFTGWQLIMPELPPSPAALARLIDTYSAADEADRQIIDSMVARLKR